MSDDVELSRHTTDHQWLTAMRDVSPEHDCRIWWPDRPGAPMRLIRSGAVTTIDHDGTTRSSLTGHAFTEVLDLAVKEADVVGKSTAVAWEDNHVVHWYIAIDGGLYVRGHAPREVTSLAEQEQLAHRIAVGIDDIRGIHRGA